MSDNKPIHTIQYGSVRASIWKNKTSWGTIHNVTVGRRYKEENNWSQTGNFGEYDLPMLAKALWDAHSWIQVHKPPNIYDGALPPIPLESTDNGSATDDSRGVPVS